LKIFPNPVAEILNIEFEYTGETVVVRTDIDGKTVKENILSGIKPGIVLATFQVADLPSGILISLHNQIRKQP
jgi:hypothetical protein